MVNATNFFGKNEWGAIFGASFALLILFGLCLISKIVLWIVFVLMLIAFLFSGYKLFFDKSNKEKGEFSELMDSIGGVVKK